jgi:hypothetical protein
MSFSMAQEPTKKKRGAVSKLRIAGGIAALVAAAISGVATVIWYRQSTSDPYVLPDAWGHISIFVPPHANSCAAEMAMTYDYNGSQSLVMEIKISGLPHLQYGPAIGIIFDGSAVPPDSPWPYFGDLHITGRLPSSPWAEYGLPFGPYLGTAWLIRLAKPGQSFQFHMSYPGSEVGDGKPAQIAGKVSDSRGVDLLTISTRLSGYFRIQDGGRITYQPPIFGDFVALPSLANPPQMRDITNYLPKNPIKICSNQDDRISTVYDSQSIDPNGDIDPYYQVDSAEPPLTQSDQIVWRDNSPGQDLTPSASLLSRQAEESNQKLQLWSTGSLTVTVALVPIGLTQMPWPVLERSRTRKRRKNLDLGSYCILVHHSLTDLREQGLGQGSFILLQKRAWTTGQYLWVETARSDLRMPILFSTEGEANISYWGVIDKISIDDATRETTCTYSEVRAVEPPRQLSELRLRNGGKPPTQKPTGKSYTVCYTPDFLV